MRVKTKNSGMKRSVNRHQVQSHDSASRQERAYEKAERQEAKRGIEQDSKGRYKTGTYSPSQADIDKMLPGVKVRFSGEYLRDYDLLNEPESEWVFHVLAHDCGLCRGGYIAIPGRHIPRSSLVLDSSLDN